MLQLHPSSKQPTRPYESEFTEKAKWPKSSPSHIFPGKPW